MRLSVEWHLPFRSLPLPCAPDHISCRAVMIPGQPFVEFAAADGRGGFEELRRLGAIEAQPLGEAIGHLTHQIRRVGQLRVNFHIDTSAFTEALQAMVNEMGDELRAVAGRAVQDRIDAMQRVSLFGVLLPRRSGIVAAFEHRYQRQATESERATLLGRSPRELAAMRQALEPVEPFPAEAMVDPQQKQRLKAAEVEALISEFEPEL